MSMNYWVVGAMFGGQEDMLPVFIKRGYWYCWDPKSNHDIPESVSSSFRKIKIDDRVAVKKMLGQGSSMMEVRAIGIVTDVDLEEWRIYVRWIDGFIPKKIEIKGCMGSLHGPYTNDPWIHHIFSI